MDNNLQKYIAFVKTVECGSFTKAAELLSYTQSTVSKMIADLEKEWNLTLLIRNRGGVTVTSDGLAVLPYVKKLITDFQDLSHFVEDMSEIYTGTLRIGTFSSVATHWLPNIMKEFRKDFPGIEYEFLLGDYTEIEQWIAEGRIDFGFLRLPTRKEFQFKLLEKDDLMVVLPSDHPLTSHSVIFPEQLDHQPFLLLEHGRKTEVSEFIEKYELSPDIRFTTWDDYSIMSMVESGFGLAILPNLILRRVPYEIEIRPLSEPVYREIGVAYRNEKTLCAAAKKFMEYLHFRNIK